MSNSGLSKGIDDDTKSAYVLNTPSSFVAICLNAQEIMGLDLKTSHHLIAHAQKRNGVKTKKLSNISQIRKSRVKLKVTKFMQKTKKCDIVEKVGEISIQIIVMATKKELLKCLV